MEANVLLTTPTPRRSRTLRPAAIIGLAATICAPGPSGPPGSSGPDHLTRPVAAAPAAAPADRPAIGSNHAYLPFLARGAIVADLPVAPTGLPATPTHDHPAPTVAPRTPAPSPSPTSPPTTPASPAPTPGVPTATVSPSATEPPSPFPTEPPASATPAPTVKPTPALECRELLANGDFERGARNWSLAVTTTEQPISLAILHRSKSTVAPYEGDWVAYLGGLDGTFFGLTSDRLAQIDSGDVVSATLSFRVAVFTEERRDRRANDKVAVFVTTGRRAEVKEAALSEEDFEADGRWRNVSVDLRGHVAGGALKLLEIQARLDGARKSWFYFDAVSITACTSPPVPDPGRGGYHSGRRQDVRPAARDQAARPAAAPRRGAAATARRAPRRRAGAWAGRRLGRRGLWQDGLGEHLGRSSRSARRVGDAGAGRQ